MKKMGGKLSNTLTLRQKAEMALTDSQSQLNLVRSESELLRLVHELEVHQIELEMQNDELLLAKEQADLATAKYFDLYEFAPSGYFVLSREGKIIQVNIAGSQIFGIERSRLKNHTFAFFVSDDSKPVFKLFLSRVFSNNTKETCDLNLTSPDSQHVHITGFAEPDNDECFVTVVDITEQKRVEKKLILANEELALHYTENARRAAELFIANEELTFQNEEKTKRAAELVLANKELSFQDSEKSKRAAELIIANKELLFQNNEKAKRAEELILANIELLFQNDEKAKRATELVLTNKELLLSNDENAKLAVELLLANKELLFQNDEKTHRSDELILANIELLFQNKEKEKRATELVVLNKLISAQRDRLEEIASLVPGVVYQYRLQPDGTSCFPYASEAIKQIYRVTPEEVRGDATNVFLNIHPDDYEGVVISIQMSAKNLSLWQHEYRVKFEDGTVRSLYGNAVPKAQADGSVLWHGFITDITDKKGIEHQLEERLKELQILFRLSQLAGEKDIALDTLYQRLVDLLPGGFQYPEITCARIVVDHVEFCTKNFKDSAWKLSAPILVNESVIGLIEIAHLEQRQEADEGPFLREERNLIDTLAFQLKQIIDRKKGEQKIVSQLALINSLLDSIPDMIFFKDTQGVYMGCNPTFCKFVGKPKKEIVGKTDHDLFEKAIADSFRQYDLEMLKQKLPRRNEEWVTYPSGRKVLLDTLKTPYWAGDGTLIGLIGISRDISERKQIENSLRESEEKYRNLYESMKDSVITTDLEGNILDCNQVCLDMLGYTMEEMKNLTYQQFNPVKWHAFEDQIIKPQITYRGYSDEYEKEYIRKDGLVIPVSLRSWLIKDKDGNPSRFWAIIRDITLRKSIEEKLKSKSSLLEAQLNATVEGILIVDNQNIRLLINQRFIDLLNIPPDILLVKDDSKLLNYVVGLTKNPQIFLEKVNYLNSHPAEKSYDEVEFLSGMVLERYSGPILNEDGKNDGRIWTFRDITSRKLNEQQIKLKSEELHKLNSERDKFFSIIAHDLRGPLGGIKGLTEMMADKSIEITETKKKEIILLLKHSAHNTFNLLENLLEWSQMDRGLTVFKPQKLRLMDLMADCINVVADAAREKEIALIVYISDSHEVFADKSMLQTVVRNLLSNAIKFTHTGGRVTISTRPAKNSMIVISVKDTGIGMSNKLRNDIFRIDANTKRPGTNGEKSTGLGLLLCHEFVGKLGGEIWVDSEQFKGTTFSFTITSINPMGNEIACPEVDFAEKPFGQLNNLKILIAEDDDISAKLIHAMVKSFSREILMAKTGDYAVEICRTNADIDLVMMDIAMPGMEGYEATRQIRQFNQEVVIIAQTTFALSADREKAFEAGCNDYIAKPFGKNELIELIKKHI